MTDPRLQCPLSTRYSKLTFLIFAVTMVTGVGAGTVAVEERTDVMGHYKVSNREQCRRLCWYRKLCARYSYKQAVTSSGVNCLLHALPLQGQFYRRLSFLFFEHDHHNHHLLLLLLSSPSSCSCSSSLITTFLFLFLFFFDHHLLFLVLLLVLL